MKGLKKNSVRPRKRVIAILLSVLMVLSIIIPSGGSGVRYNAYAEGEESAIGEGVDLSSEEGTDEEEVTSEESLTSEESSEETTEDGTEDSSEDLTEENSEDSDTEVSTEVSSDAGTDEEIFEDTSFLGAGNVDDTEEEYIEETNLLGDGEDNTKLIDITDNITVTLVDGQTISRSSSFKVNITYNIPVGEKLSLAKSAGSGSNVIWYYNLNEFVERYPALSAIVNKSNSGDILESGVDRGDYTIIDNIVLLDIDDGWIATQGESPVQGTFQMEVALDADNIGAEDSISFRFPGSSDDFVLTFPTESSSEISKSTNGADSNVVVSEKNADGTYTVEYTIRVKSNTNHNSAFSVLDELGSDKQNYVSGSFKVREGWSGAWTDIDNSNVSIVGQKATVDLYGAIGNIKANTDYFITYSTNVQGSELGNTISNSAKCSWEDGRSTDWINNSVKLKEEVSVTKGHEDLGNNKYKYTIVIGDDSTDLSGVNIKDSMIDLQYLDGDVLLNGNKIDTLENGLNDGTFTTSTYDLFNYTTPSNFGNGPINIEYIVKIPTGEAAAGFSGNKNIENTVTVTGDNVKGSKKDSFTYNFDTVGSISKELVSFDAANKKINWKITVTNNADFELTNVSIGEYSYGDGTTQWNGNVEKNIDWSSVSIEKSTGEDVTSGYEIDSTNKKINFSSFPANTTYVISLSSVSDTDFINGRYYGNDATLYVNGNEIGKAQPVEKYTVETQDFDMDKDYSYDSSNGEYTWTVTINPNKDEIYPDHKLYFTDELPDGMEFVGDSMSIYCEGTSSNGETFHNNWIVNNINPTISSGVMNPIDITEVIHSLGNWTGTKDIGISGVKTVINYKTKLSETEMNSIKSDVSLGNNTSHSYTNTAKVTDSTGSTYYNQASKTAEYDYKVITKSDLSESTLEYDIVNFRIDINPDGLTLNGGEPLTLTDELETNIELVFGGNNALTVVDENEDDMIANGTAKVSYNDDSRKITIVVPDAKYAIVKYSVKTRQTGDVTINNTALLVGGGHNYSDSVHEEHHISYHSATIGGGAIRLHKIDENDLNKILTGAEFALYKINFTVDNNGTTDVLDDDVYTMGTTEVVTSRITSSNELFTLENVEPGILYYWVETKAPDGYILDDTPHYFTAYNVGATNDETDNNYKIAKGIDNGVQRAYNNEIKVNTVELGSYVWNVCNKKGTSIQIKKELDSSGDTPSSVTDYKVKITFSNGGTYTVTRGNSASSTVDFTTATAKELSIKADETITISGIPEGTTYTVTEDLTGYTGFDEPTIVYSDDTYKMTGSDAVDTVTITNKYTETSTELPAEIEVKKVDSDDNTTTISGAVFKIYSDADCSTLLPVNTNGLAANEITTGTDGTAKFTFSDVSSLDGNNTGATYYLKEVSVPAPYKADTDTIYKANIKVDGTTATVTVGKKDDATLSSSPLVVENNKVANVKVTKHVTFDVAPSSDIIDAATFKAKIKFGTALTGTFKYDKYDKSNSKIVSDGTITFNNSDTSAEELEFNDHYYYIIKDVKVGTTVTAEETGDYQTVYDTAKYEYDTTGSNPKPAAISVSDSSANEITILNNYSQKKGSLSISKTKSGESVDKTAFKVIVKNESDKYIKADGSTSDTEVKLDVTVGTPLVINNLVPGKYTVEEDKDDAKSGVVYTLNVTGEGEYTVGSGENVNVPLNNEYKAGKLKIQKNVTADTGVTFADDDFEISINVAGAGNGTYTATGTAGITSVTFVNNVATITLKNGKDIEIKGLPYNAAYTVTETTPTKESSDGKGTFTEDTDATTGSKNKTGNTSEIVTDANTVIIVNKYAENKGKVTVKKAFSGINALPADFKITNTYNSDVFTVANKQSGSGTASDPYIWYIDEVPVGTNVTFTESGFLDNDYSVNVNNVANASGSADVSITSVKKGNASDNEVSYKNDYEIKKGSFTIEKKITSKDGDGISGSGYNVNHEFEVTVSFTFPDGQTPSNIKVNETDTTLSDNKVTFTIKEGDSNKVTLSDIPFGTTYTVVENLKTADIEAGYQKDTTTGNIVYGTGTSLSNGTIGDTSTNVVVNNKYKWPVAGHIVITKKVTGDRTWSDINSYISFRLYKLNGSDYDVVGTQISAPTDWNDNGDGTYSYTIPNLENGTYKVVEEVNETADTSLAYYNFKTYAGNTINPTAEQKSVDGITIDDTTKDGSAYFVNDYQAKKGGFKITKNVENDPGDNVVFPVTVELNYDNETLIGGTYTVDGESAVTFDENTTNTGIVISKADKKATISLELKHNQSVTFTDIPYGTTYAVTEGVLDGAAYNRYSWKSGTEHIVYGDTGKIVSDNAIDEVIVNNVYTPEGKIIIYKTVNLPTGVSWDDIKGSISFIISDNDNATDDIEISGSSLTWDNTLNAYIYTKGDIPLGKTYTVTESVNTASGTAWFKYDVTTKAGTTQAGLTDSTNREVAVGAISATNPVGKAYFENGYTVKTGKLIIKKSFDPVPTGVANYNDEEFDVVVTLVDENDSPVSGTYGTTTFNSEGKATVQISVNTSVEITGIPYGYKYSYVEQTKTGYQNVSNGTVAATVISAASDTQTITNKYAPDKGSLKLVKKFADDSKYKSDNVNANNQIKFTVTGPDNYSETVDYYDIKTSGEVVLSDLIPGDYTVTEISNVSTDTYIRTTKIKVETTGTDETIDSKVVGVSAGVETTVIVTNDYQYNEKAELDISKLVNGANSGDKKFELEIVYTKDATTKYVAVDSASSTGYKLVDERPTGNAVPVIKSGEVLKIRNLPFGTYAVSEKTGSIDLDNYIFNAGTSTTSGSVTFTSNTTQTVTLKNNYSEDRSVKISKLVFGTDTALENAKLQLIEGDTVKEEWTSDGTIKTITGLKSGVDYKLHEVSAPDGYTTVKDITFVIDEDNKVTVTPGKAGEATATGNVVNVYDKKTSVKISKVDITNEKELPGATIQILDENGDVVTDENGNPLEWISTTTPKEIIGLKTGVTYTLRETVAPDGYQLTTDTVFKLNKDGSLDGTATTTTVSNEGVLLVEDAPLGAFAVNKKGYYNELCSDGANATIPLEGVKFTLTKPDDTTFGQTKATDENGVATFTGLQPGTYELKEIQTIENYILDESVYTIKINADGSNDGLKDASGNAVEGNVITNDVPRTDLQLVKVNLSNKNVKLPGSRYGLFRAGVGLGANSNSNASTDTGSTSNGQLVKIAEAVTDKDGILRFKGVLTGVDYTVQELAAPNGFYVSEQPITISFKTDEQGNVVIDKVSDGNGTIVLSATGEITWLEPQIKVSFTKQDMNGNNLAGAKLKVVDSNGNDVISWTSTTEAYVVEGTFTAGESYKLVEVEAPEGYEIAEPVEFTINEKAGAEGADVISVVMKDKEKTTTTVTPPEKTTPPSVKTGDTAPIKPVTSMMFISLAGIIYLLILGRRRKDILR